MGKVKAGLRVVRSKKRKKPYEKAEANIEAWSKASKERAAKFVKEWEHRGTMMPKKTRVNLGAGAPKKRGK